MHRHYTNSIHQHLKRLSVNGKWIALSHVSAEMLQMYNQSYEMALQEVAAQQIGRGRRDEHQSGVIRMPRPSFLPGYSKPGPSGPIEGGQ